MAASTRAISQYESLTLASWASRAFVVHVAAVALVEQGSQWR